ncbi:MAG: methylenetetrahydrofolate reductase [Thermodesulfobacteriota bacterium]
MKILQLYESKKASVISLEFFPPKDAGAFEKTVDELALLQPDYVTVTFGAGGSTREGSYQTVKRLIEDKNLPVVAYIAGYGLGPNEITAVLDKYQALGIGTIFVIRGDKPREADFVPHPDSFNYAYEMLRFIRERYDFTLGCAGYPEGHIEAENLEADIEHLKLKIDSGAEYVVTQFCYDNSLFANYVEKCRARGITVPIIPGIMPVYSLKLTRTLTKLCGASIPESMKRLLDGLADAGSDTVLDFGIDQATEQCRGLLRQKVPGLHFYTMDRSRSTCEIIRRLKSDRLI